MLDSFQENTDNQQVEMRREKLRLLLKKYSPEIAGMLISLIDDLINDLEMQDMADAKTSLEIVQKVLETCQEILESRRDLINGDTNLIFDALNNQLCVSVCSTSLCDSEREDLWGKWYIGICLHAMRELTELLKTLGTEKIVDMESFIEGNLQRRQELLGY
ncbi:MAG: hypothetical protein PHU71_04260 [Candidatus Gracilibacteria bacterium]|nr:hypothetical protein [Candidatus Gracilibacteria bacterium]